MHFVTWLALCNKGGNHVERLPHEVSILLDWSCLSSVFPVLVFGYIGITYVRYAVVDDKTVRHLPGCPLTGRMGIGICSTTSKLPA